MQLRGLNIGPCLGRVSNVLTKVINASAATYSVSGNVYVDIDGSKTKNGSEPNYVANPSDIQADGTTITTNNGIYSISNLTPGTHTVTYLTKPAGYNMTHPTSSVPPSFSITVGPGCTASPPPAGNCDAGNNITNLNFGINNSSAWIQGYDLDMRFDDGFTDTLPAGKYAMDTDS